MMIRWKPHLLAALLLICAIGAVFGRSLQFDFIKHHDDAVNITDNRYFKPPRLSSVVELWKAPYEMMYIPVTYSVWAGLSRLAYDPSRSSFDALWFHLANLVVHFLNAFLLYLILRAFTGFWPSVVGALLFAVHPIQVEPVVWVSGMKDLLGTLFTLLALWRFVRWRVAQRPTGREACFILTFFILACLAKPTAVILIGLFLCLDLFFFRAFRWAWLYGLLLVVAAVAIWGARLAQPEDGFRYLTPVRLRPFVMIDSWLFYLRQIVWPAGFVIDYSRDPQAVLSLRSTYFLWIFPVMAAGLIFWKASPFIKMAFALFFVALLPTSGVVNFNHQTFSTVADRYAYLAMLSPCLLVAWGLNTLGSRRAVGVAVGVLCGLGALSHRDLPRWKDAITLFTHAADRNPRSWVTNHILGLAYASRRDTAQAIARFRRASEIRPDFLPARLSLIPLLLKERRHPKAQIHIDQANLLIREQLLEKSQWLLQRQDYVGARSVLESILKQFPGDTQALAGLTQVAKAEKASAHP